MHCVYPVNGYWHIVHVDRGVGRFVALVGDQACAQRIAALLDRHGMVDAPLTEVPGA